MLISQQNPDSTAKKKVFHKWISIVKVCLDILVYRQNLFKNTKTKTYEQLINDSKQMVNSLTQI